MGYKYEEVNGLMNAAARAKALSEFRTNPECNVLLLSGVGLCGLNMAFANIVIIVVSFYAVLFAFLCSHSRAGQPVVCSRGPAAHRPCMALSARKTGHRLPSDCPWDIGCILKQHRF